MMDANTITNLVLGLTVAEGSTPAASGLNAYDRLDPDLTWIETVIGHLLRTLKHALTATHPPTHELRISISTHEPAVR